MRPLCFDAPPAPARQRHARDADPTRRRLTRLEGVGTLRGMSRTRAVLACVSVAVTTVVAGCGPSIDAAAKADIDRRVAALKPGAASVPAPSAAVPMPLAPGQWTQHKMTDDKGQPSFLTYKIVGEEAGALWVEVVNETYTGRMVQKLLVAFGSRTDPAQIEVRAMKTRDQKGNVNELPREMMPMMQSMYRGVVATMIINWQGLPQEAAAVPAGQFASCYKARADVQWGPFRSVSDSWAHPAVPISGVVRSVGVDKPFTMELVAFGLSGATSEM